MISHPRVLRSPWPAGAAWTFVGAILASPALGILVETDRHAALVEELLREIPHASGNFFQDAHTAVLMREHGIRRIVTRDTDFHRFSFLEIVDPLAA